MIPEKKKILFVIPSLDAGGAEKALVNLLNILPQEAYSIEVLLFSRGGIFESQIPKSIRILQPQGYYFLFSQHISKALPSLLKKGQIQLAAKRLQYFFSLRKHPHAAQAEQASWKYWSASFPALDTHYDVAISFLEKSGVYYIVDKVKATKKIAWIHTQYDKSGLDARFDCHYFKKLDSLVTISEECKHVLDQLFKEVVPTIVIENVSSKKLIEQLATEPLSLPASNIVIATIGRLSKEKGQDLALEAAKLLHQKGINFLWVFIGDGAMKQELIATATQLGIAQNILWAGNQSNPYKYLNKANIYCQPSRYEGKSIAIDEAKLLAKPIVVTNYSTVGDQIQHLETGFIVEQTPESIAEGLFKLITNLDLRNQLSQKLKDYTIDEAAILQKFSQLIYGT